MAVLPALADMFALEVRLGRDLEGAEAARAQAALDDASALVREEARRDWLDADGNPNPPSAVLTVVLTAALRVVRNPDGYTSEAEGDYSYRRSEDTGLGVYLTEEEKTIVRRYRGTKQALWTQPTTRGEHWCSTIWADDTFGCEPFPIDVDPGAA